MTGKEFYDTRLMTLVAQERGAGERFHREVKIAADRYDTARGRLNTERDKLESLKDEPVVVVRRGPGPTPTVFHREDRQCGWKPSYGERMFMTEAFSRGLKGCKSCACNSSSEASAEVA